MSVLLMIVAFLTILICAWYAHYYSYHRHLRRYRGPTPLPLLGHALYFKSLKDYLPGHIKFQHQYGNAVKVQFGFHPPLVVISHTKLLESLLGSTKILDKSREYDYIKHWLGTGLLTSSSTKWKKHRKILTPAFHFQILEQFISTFNLYSDILINKLAKEAGKVSTDIYPFLTLCSLDIICASAMGTAVNAQEDGTSEYVQSVKEIARLLMERMVSFLPDCIYALGENQRTQTKTIQRLHSYTNSVIATRKCELQNMQKSSKNSDSDLGIKQRKTFLDLLLQYKLDGGDITDEEIREEVDTFMFEGHDTTAAAMGFTLYCLANNPQVQENAMAELEAIFGDDAQRHATSKDLHEMKYLDMVIRESLRLYPPVPIFSRTVSEDTQFDGSVFPKNATIGIFAFGLHRNPEIYPDPEKFDPQRFTPENQAQRSSYAYIPFSAGSRNCIGQRFAMMELKSVISKVLRTYKLFPSVPEHTLVLVPELILKSRSGICIRLEKR